jgi:hypothetical protein
MSSDTPYHMGQRERPYHKSPQTKTCDRTLERRLVCHGTGLVHDGRGESCGRSRPRRIQDPGIQQEPFPLAVLMATMPYYVMG